MYPTNASCFKLLEMIGSGTSTNEAWRASVVDGVHDGDEVCVKVLDLEEYKQENMESIRVFTLLSS